MITTNFPHQGEKGYAMFTIVETLTLMLEDAREINADSEVVLALQWAVEMAKDAAGTPKPDPRFERIFRRLRDQGDENIMLADALPRRRRR